MSAITKVYNNKETRGDIKVQKTFMIPLDRIYEEPGFNIREHDQVNIERMAQAWWSQEQLPPVVVETQPNGTFKLIDGHRRYHGAKLCNQINGETITHLEAKESIAHTELDQLVFMVGTTQGVELKSWELSLVVHRLHKGGLDNEEIGKIVNRGVSNVKHHLAVARLPADIFELVKEGKIQDSLAVEIVSKQGGNAVYDALERSQGKKVKRAHTRLWTNKAGKEAVTALSSAKVNRCDVTGTTSFIVSNHDAELMLKAIEMVKSEKVVTDEELQSQEQK